MKGNSQNSEHYKKLWEEGRAKVLNRIKGVTELLAVTVGIKSFGFFPLPSVPSPGEVWPPISCAREEGRVAKCCLWCPLQNGSHFC